MSSYYEKFIATGEVKCIDDEIPFEIPQGWEWERWGNIVLSIQYGYNAPAIERGDIKMVRISDIHDNVVQWKDVPFCNIEAHDIDTYLLKENDILFARTGGTVGKSFLVQSVPEPAIYAGYLIRTRYSQELCPQYLKSFMESQLYWKQLKSGTIATAQPNCNGKTLGRMLLPIPPKAEQIRLVQKLASLTPMFQRYIKAQQDLDNLNENIDDKLRKSILQEAIQGKLVPQIAEEGTAEKLLTEIRKEKEQLVKEGKLKKSSLNDSVIYKGDDNKYFEKIGKTEKDITDEIPFEIPNSWCWMRLNNLCNITNGFTPLRTEPKFWENGKINWFTIEDIRKQGEYIYQTTQKITELAVSKDRIVRAGSVLLCCTASVGQCAMTMIPTTTNQQFNALTVKEEYRCLINDEFLYLFAKTLEPILHDLAGKTTFEFISVKKVGNILIPIPPVLEQHRICEITNKALASIMSR